jgi:colicin import membrane protein
MNYHYCRYPLSREASMALVSAESVAAAAEALAGRGERISVASVRTEIGGGSPNALAPLVAAWKAARATAEPDAAPEDSAPPVPASPPAAVSDLRRVSAAMDGLVAAVLADVTERIEAVRVEADARVQAEREAAARTAEQHRAALAAVERDRDAARGETSAAEAETAEALAEVDALAAQLAVAREQSADLERHLIETAARADAAERALHEGLAALQRRVEEMAAAWAEPQTAAVDDAGDRAGKKPGSGRGRDRGKATSPSAKSRPPTA